MAMDLAAMIAEFQARGFGDMTGTTDLVRVKRWLNDAMHEIDDMADWSYRNATTTGIAPLTISDLGTIESVADVTGVRQLQPANRSDLRAMYGDLTTGGYPLFYYVVGGNVITLYPTSTSLSLTVDYWKISPDLSANGDVPLMPDRFRVAIVDYAVERASRDRGDEVGARAARAQGDARVGQMMQVLLSPQHQATSDYVMAVGDDC